MADHRIVIFRIRRPRVQTLNDELQWFCNSLGLFNLRDKDRSMFRLFIELLKASKENSSLSSDELAFRLTLTRGTVMHHVNKLIDAGLVVPEHKRYALREHNLQVLLDKVKDDFERSYDELRKAAKEIDEKLGI